MENKKRIAAYCRVSTDSRDQANSFESQCRFFAGYIENRPMREYRGQVQRNEKRLTG